jgi:hypothetical protein
MGKRILGIVSGTLLAIVGTIVGIAVWRSRSPKIHAERNEDHSNGTNSGHPPSHPTTAVVLPVESPIQQHPGPRPQHAESRQDNQKFGFRRTLTNWSFWMALGTMILAGFSVRGFYLASDSAHKQLRAYLFIARDVHIDIDKTGLVTFNLNVRNKGQTPASQVTPRSRFVVSDGNSLPPTIHDFFADKSPLGRIGPLTSIGPNDEITVPVYFDIGLDNFEKMKHGEKVLWSLVIFGYEDIYGVEQHIGARFFWEGKNGVMEPLAMDSSDPGF